MREEGRENKNQGKKKKKKLTSWFETFSPISPWINPNRLASALTVTSTVAVPGPSTGLLSSRAPRTAIESPSQFNVS